jgi:mannose-6-phosphate isomerase-like protein (cupin superfamily)
MKNRLPGLWRFFFPGEEKIPTDNKLRLKILIVAPRKRLSWQYHHRRAELWKCISDSVAVVTSDTDEEQDLHPLKEGDIINLKQGERHRLIGLDDWGIVAEIWKHADANNPSNEDDIVRLQDDFGR